MPLSCSSSQSSPEGGVRKRANNVVNALLAVSRGVLFVFYKSLTACTLNNTSPLPFGLSPIAQTCAISLKNFTSFARGEVGTHIERYRSLIMPLRFVRQAVANGRRSRLYYSSSSALAFLAALRLVFRLRKGRVVV